MDYESMYELFEIDHTRMGQLEELTKNSMLHHPVQENVTIKTVVVDEAGREIVKQEAADAELV